MAVIRAIDLGFGNTKYTQAGSGDQGGIACRSFPSLVAEPGDVAVGSEVLGGKRNTVVVPVGKGHFEVGPDVERALGTRDGRSLHTDYSATDQYMALSLGALSYMGVGEIDILVLGLPVNATPAKFAALEKRMTGEHTVANGRKVTVGKVMVVAQPLGGFMDYCQRAGLFKTINDQTSLLVDVGFFTLDWVVARGLEPIHPRSGGYNAGVSEVLKRINGAIKKELDTEDISINRLDRALREGSIRLFGQKQDMSKFMPAAQGAINEGLNALQATLGANDDIDNIFVCGGGASLYTAQLKQRFPRHNIAVVEEPVFANVRGFQLIGERTWRVMSRAQPAKAA